MSNLQSVCNIFPWILLAITLLMLVMVDYEKILRAIFQIFLVSVIVLGGLGYFIASRLAGWLPRWFPGQGDVAAASIVMGVVALAALFALIDWKHLWARYRWQLIVGAEIALFLMVYGSGIYLLVPGVSAAETEVQSFVHLKPVMIRVVSVQEAQEISGLLFSENPHGKFMVLKVNVTNTSAEPIILWGRFELYDARGRRFEMATYSWFSGIDSINPGLSSMATIAFDVPDPHGLWWLTVYPDIMSNLRGVSIPFLF